MKYADFDNVLNTLVVCNKKIKFVKKLLRFKILLSLGGSLPFLIINIRKTFVDYASRLKLSI